MATIVNYGRTGATQDRNKARLPDDPSCQPCPDCGGLQCLCRPRFFAGQLLSEQDLNRLDQYITEKHKLHNRHLFGSGVVCGLEVKCAPCDNGSVTMSAGYALSPSPDRTAGVVRLVTVSAGYALSPCGEDIVVCKTDTVNICELIARCRTDTEPDCAPYRAQDACGDVIEDWILSIRYAESPSRGITALTGAGQSCGCSCAGPCSGTCTCGGGAGCTCGTAQGRHAAEPPGQPRLNRGAPPSCEPTLTCETYRYDVFRAPPDKKRDPQEGSGFSGIFAQFEGEMMARIACCLKQLEDALPPAPGDIAQPIPVNLQMTWFQWGCQMRTALANYLVQTGGHDCEAVAKLQAIVVPAPNPSLSPADYRAAMEIAVVLFAILVFEAMIACICSNALPPCPPPGDPRVPLAVIKVRRRDCHIVSVCNWHPLRKHVLTFPTLGYWFGFIPIARLLREAMHWICCELFGLRKLFGKRDVTHVHHHAMMRGQPAADGAASPVAGGQPLAAEFSLNHALSLDPFAGVTFDKRIFEAIASRQSLGKGALTWGELAAATLQRPAVTIDPGLRGDDRAAALQRVAASGPLGVLTAMLGPLATPLAVPVAGGEAMRASVAAAGHEAEFAEMRAMLKTQAREIEMLKAAISGGDAASENDRRG